MNNTGANSIVSGTGGYLFDGDTGQTQANFHSGLTLILLLVLLIPSVAQAKSQVLDQQQQQAQQCFADAQLAYDFMIKQQQLAQQQAEWAEQNIKVNINQAGEAELTLLKGIGSKKAQQIILYRDAFGPFATIDDLAKVKGIGAKTISNNSARLSIE
ncbi:ComEA family DNA-binding protein [Psychrobacter sp. FDAARGOS_221]|uniref:ComEA family DNA-binding protein n=1 Tax=Psychrobacter sp. FDAARGOS_221 TaxID=1975705 RepID=UPI000BB56F90|nr:ComEA family DNA-binding protein [Psychrobacter sp. FDAARGOS_221]PNK60480.1 competence protein ComEA [Psychrobacter sp. FDAARGOS_221]